MERGRKSKLELSYIPIPLSQARVIKGVAYYLYHKNNGTYKPTISTFTLDSIQRDKMVFKNREAKVTIPERSYEDVKISKAKET